MRLWCENSSQFSNQGQRASEEEKKGKNLEPKWAGKKLERGGKEGLKDRKNGGSGDEVWGHVGRQGFDELCWEFICSQ